MKKKKSAHEPTPTSPHHGVVLLVDTGCERLPQILATLVAPRMRNPLYSGSPRGICLGVIYYQEWTIRGNESGGWGHSRDGALRKRLGVVPGPPTFVTLLWREGKTTSLQRTLASQPFGGAYEGRELVMERGHAAGEMRILKKASVYFSFFFVNFLVNPVALTFCTSSCSWFRNRSGGFRARVPRLLLVAPTERYRLWRLAACHLSATQSCDSPRPRRPFICGQRRWLWKLLCDPKRAFTFFFLCFKPYRKFLSGGYLAPVLPTLFR